MKVKSESEVAQLCPTPSNPMDRSPPGSSVHGIFQARVLEWAAIAFTYLTLTQTPYPDIALNVIQLRSPVRSLLIPFLITSKSYRPGPIMFSNPPHSEPLSA